MSKKSRLFLLLLFAIFAVAAAFFFLKGINVAVLDPKGLIGEKQRTLLIVATWLMMLVMIPVFILTGFIAWRYRASNKKADYAPDWDNNWVAEAVWWGVPLLIIVILSVIGWKSCHELDPFKPIDHEQKPLEIQVVALQWKWLFLYPEQGIASVNVVQFPEKTPLRFLITADAPMNSFWIPQLGGQIYAMPGMKTKLYLIANETGNFQGVSANLSGLGFSGMRFQANALTAADFDAWVKEVKSSSDVLEYEPLVVPSRDNPAAFYRWKDRNLFEQIVMKYMVP